MKNVTLKSLTAAVAALCLTALLSSSCIKDGAVFFNGPRVISGDKKEHIFIPETDEEFTLVSVSYKDVQTDGKWKRVNATVNNDGTSFVDWSWFRVEVKNSSVIVNVEENPSGERRGLNITLDSVSGKSHITVYQNSL